MTAGPAGPDDTGGLLIARVVPDVTGLDKQFDYLVPPAMQASVRVGSVVRAPLHGRRVGGWVVALGADPGDISPERLLPIAQVSGEGPSPELVELSAWAAHRWVSGRRRPFLVAASPPRRVRSIPPPRRGGPPPEPVSELAREVLDAGGGVLRLPPNDDLLPAVLAACRHGAVLALTPSVDGARILGARLRRAGRAVAVMPDDWADAAGGVDVVVGARAAAWAPCPGLGAVVVLDEHDEALQEERSPTWHARDVARERARRAGVPALLVSPSPSVVAVATNRVVRRAPAADERASWPVLTVVDRGDEEPWKRSLVTSPLIRELRDPARRVVCVLNTTGRARLLACRACRSLQRCERCDAAVAQADDGRLVCRRCATQRPAVCQVCGSTGLAQIRHGVTRLRDDLEAAAGRPVAVTTGDSAPLDVGDGAPAVVVGTEAALHRVRSADVVAFLDFDAELLAPRYRAAEQAMALLVRAARLVGRRADGGRVLVQTSLPRHEVVQAALLADPGRLTAVETERRRTLGFPPFGGLAWIGGPGAAEMADALRADDRVQVGGGPDDGFLVRASGWRPLADALGAAPRPPRRRVRIEVDPPRR